MPTPSVHGNRRSDKKCKDNYNAHACVQHAHVFRPQHGAHFATLRGVPYLNFTFVRSNLQVMTKFRHQLCTHEHKSEGQYCEVGPSLGP